MTPTISAINPPSGHSGGKTLVEVVGTGFALPPAPPGLGPVPVPPPSVLVTFGGVAAAEVLVLSDTLLYALTPEGDPDNGPVAVLVQNCDASGEPILGEVATAAYTFLRPNLSEESELARVIRALLQSLKRQVIKNVVFTTHTDYDDTTGDSLNYTTLESLPAIVLANLTVPEDRTYAANEPTEVPDPTGTRFIRRRPPLVVDVKMTVVGVSNDPVEILNLMQVTRLYFKKNPRLTLLRDAADASKGTVSYDLGFDIAGDVGVQHVGDNTNVESFSGTITVYGVLLEDIPGLPRGGVTGVPADMPNEATTGFGWVSQDAPGAVQVALQQKP